MADGPLTGYLVAKYQLGWAGLCLLFIKCYLKNSISMPPTPLPPLSAHFLQDPRVSHQRPVSIEKRRGKERVKRGSERRRNEKTGRKKWREAVVCLCVCVCVCVCVVRGSWKGALVQRQV